MGLFSLIFRLGADNTDFNKGLDEATKSATKAAKEMTTSMGEHFGQRQLQKAREYGNVASASIRGIIGIATTAAAAIGAIFTKSVGEGGRLQDLSDRLGLSPEEVQKMELAGKLVGVTIEQQAGALKKLTVAQVEARNGNEELLKAFDQFGVSLDDLRSKNASELFRQISTSLKGLGPNADQLAALVKITGRAADELVPLLKAGAQDNSLIPSIQVPASQVAVLDGIGDAWTRITALIKASSVGLTAVIADTLTFGAFSKDIEGRFAAGGDAKTVFQNLLAREREGQLTPDQQAQKAKDDEKARREADRIAERTQQARTELAAAQRRLTLSRLGPEQKIEFLTREKDAQIRLGAAEPGAERGLRAAARGAELELEIDQLREQLNKSRTLDNPLKDALLKPTPADSLVSIGNFLGTNPAADTNSALKRVETVLKRIDRNTARTADKTLLLE